MNRRDVSANSTDDGGQGGDARDARELRGGGADDDGAAASERGAVHGGEHAAAAAVHSDGADGARLPLRYGSWLAFFLLVRRALSKAYPFINIDLLHNELIPVVSTFSLLNDLCDGCFIVHYRFFFTALDVFELDTRDLSGQLPDQLKVRMAYQAAKGMHFLHSSGIVHRDLKVLYNAYNERSQ